MTKLKYSIWKVQEMDIEQGVCGICVIRSNIDSSCVMGMKKLIDYICEIDDPDLDETTINQFDLYRVAYFKCKEALFIKNLNAKYRQGIIWKYSNILRKEALEDFRLESKKVIVFELSYGEEANIVDFRYLYMIANYCRRYAKTITFQFRIFKELFENERYIPISQDEYFKLRTFSLLTDNNDNFFCLYKYNENESWGRLFSESEVIKRIGIEKDKQKHSAFEMIGRVTPMIPINEMNYKVLCSSFLKASSPFKEILQKYDGLLDGIYREQKNAINEIVKSDNYLECLFFYAMCTYVGVKLDKDALNLMHERCMDCAQGVLQLVENAFLHAACNDELGCASLSIRVRNKDEATYCVGKNKLLDDVHRFLEIYVVDLLYEEKNYKGIVDKFLENVNSRYEGMPEEKKQEWSEKCGNPYRWAKDKEIRLKDMIAGTDIETTYKKYVSMPEVIAYHYGLEIFNNAVESNDGYLAVWSKEFYQTDNSRINYRAQEMMLWGGTSFIIYIPLHEDERKISFVDTITSHNMLAGSPNSDEGIKKIDIISELQRIKDSYVIRDKNKYVEKVYYAILNQIEEARDETIYVFDCLGIEEILLYEILAKAIFMLLSRDSKVEKAINNIAIINLDSRSDVIKVFRQFALFYDREGKNSLMKNKNVYLVDGEAEMDIAFGGRIDEMISNMQVQLIWGGIGETVKKIVYVIGGRRLHE